MESFQLVMIILWLFRPNIALIMVMVPLRLSFPSIYLAGTLQLLDHPILSPRPSTREQAYHNLQSLHPLFLHQP
jgi:hypothetical protein